MKKKISILTLFPEMFTALQCSILGKAIKKEILDISIVNIRDYSKDKHKKCDDYAFGGGAGMLMMAQPICDCIDSIDPNRQARRIYLSPKGTRLSQKEVERLATYDNLLLLCGHYEGVDQRAIDLEIDEEISIGDYVLTGGELPAMVLVDTISRYFDGVLGSQESTKEESFTQDLLEYPQYTRPAEFRGLKVPEVLLNGNHKEINLWRRQQQVELTKSLRPDLVVDNPLVKEHEELLKELKRKEERRLRRKLRREQQELLTNQQKED